ncbi:MAG: type II toxin-antitoxin system HicB family antitoxin [Nitrospirae bacterium]|nr:type II toxin-antitoxin system HicB family antitoxin [Nitrospirota bacterium]
MTNREINLNKNKTYTFKVVVEPDDDRWFAYCPALHTKGAATWGYTQEEALKNIREVVEMTVETMLEDNEPIPVIDLVKPSPLRYLLRSTYV